MLIATTDIAEIGTAGHDMWLLGAFALFVAAGLGFAAGFFSARMRDQTKYQRARRGLVRLFETARHALDNAQEVCGLLERASEPVFHPEEAEQLARRSKGLFESISRIVLRHQPPAPDDAASHAGSAAGKSSNGRALVPQKLEWNPAQLHPVTGLPDAAAFKLNLDLLLQHGSQSRRPGGLLSVQIDKFSNLRTRFGAAGADTLLKKLAFIVCRSVRDQDLVCQSAGDQIAVLIPEADVDAGARLARAVRDAVRHHHFRIEEQGDEILVTASFGYVACQPDDHADTLLDRGTDALRLSQRLGRNQLHVHNGEAVLHCAAAG